MFKPGRMISRFTAALDRILILALSVAALVLAADPTLAVPPGAEPLPIVAAIERFRGLLITAALVLLALNLNAVQFILFNIWNSEGKRYISSKTASGAARVSLDAIQRSLQATAAAMPEVGRCRLDVYRVGHARYKVTVLFWMREEGRSVINISEKLRLVLKKRFAELVSISPQDRVDFDITLAGMHREGRGHREAARGRHAGLPADFKGPVYPVEGET